MRRWMGSSRLRLMLEITIAGAGAAGAADTSCDAAAAVVVRPSCEYITVAPHTTPAPSRERARSSCKSGDRIIRERTRGILAFGHRLTPRPERVNTTSLPHRGPLELTRPMREFIFMQIFAGVKYS